MKSGSNVFPFLLFGLFLLLIMRQAQGSNSQAMSFGKSRARMVGGDKPTVTFADVAGVDDEELSIPALSVGIPNALAIQVTNGTASTAYLRSRLAMSSWAAGSGS